MTERRVEDYANPLFLFGKILNALLLDPIDADLARMRLMKSSTHWKLIWTEKFATFGCR